MKYLRGFLLAVATLSVVMFFACSKSSSNNPVSNNNTGGLSFTFKVGSKFVFKQWSLDTTTGAKLDTSLKAVHQIVIASGLTFQGKSNVYEVLDTVFADSTVTTVGTVDTLYYAIDGNTVYQYGFMTQIFSIVVPGITLPPKWDEIVNIGGSNWLVDTTRTSPAGLYPLRLTLHGTDLGNSSIMVGSDTLQWDHVGGNGNINIFATDTSASPIFVFTINGDMYLSYNPAIGAKSVISRVNSNIGTIPGFERDLVSFSLN